MIEIKDIAEYEETDSELAKYTISDLHHRIGKAIEYIEGRYNGEVLTHTFDKDNVGELLEILKGSDKE